ncbi:MAG: DUF4236 domain-containing protein [Paludibacteraceae bacterium]|nr:DUF4236 domain-containing protein [Paludibacteraceae bacterium]
MAWQFRKRIKIAPGLFINLSKSRVSATIGTRGASVTVGKNGTTLNTGIPGTGLYKRTKLSSNSKKTLKKHQGCEEINESFETTIENKQTMKNWENPFLLNGNVNMSDDLLSRYERSINRIGYFMDKYCMGSEFINIVKFYVPQMEKTYIPAMVASDVITCVERIGKSIDVTSELGIPLTLLAARLMLHREVKRNLFYIMGEDTYDGATGFINTSKELRESATGFETFFISTFLSCMNQERKEKYLELLYDFANIVISLDANVDPKEVEFLNHIIKLKNSNSDNENIAEKKETLIEKEEGFTQTQPIFQDAIKELETLIGLDSVKKEVQTLTNFIRVQQERSKCGLKSSFVSYHCLFTGNPGTGKTTVARIVASIYKDLGILKKGHLVETDRAGLVGEYVGHTAVKTNKIIDSALDGVLFIDEAYSLIGGGENDFGKEAIATLLKRMEDNRDRLVVILAGYTQNMKQFINSNPGLQSRFNRYIEFPDYSNEELYQIFEFNLSKYEYHITDEAQKSLQQIFLNAVSNKDKNFGNGRFVRNVFEKILECQANRLATEPNLTAERLSEITIKDLPSSLLDS